MPEVPAPDEPEPEHQVVTDGYFEEELNVDAEAAGDFLVALGEQLQESDEVTLTGDGWELPFAYAEPVEIDIEFQGNGEPELEVELEMDGAREEDEAPDVA